MENTIWLGLPIIEWVGYIASTVVLISLSLASITKLRIYNLIGASIFSFYGFYIGALPVGIMNFIICLFNIYYLRILYFRKEKFDVIEVQRGDGFLNKFLKHYEKDIANFFPAFNTDEIKDKYILLALRDMNVVGVFMSTKNIDGVSEILLDYVTPQYRDYKMGKFIFTRLKDFFIKQEVKKLICHSDVAKQKEYLGKMGFKADSDKNNFELNII